jgi:hypothetical protein
MLDETEPLLEYKDRSKDNRKKDNENCNNGFFSSIYGYLKQPRFWDWVIVGVIIVAVIATIVLLCV